MDAEKKKRIIEEIGKENDKLNKFIQKHVKKVK